MIRPMEHSGNSANISYYRERKPEPGEHYVWASVLCSTLTKVEGKLVHKHVPDYYVTVCREGQGEIAAFTYTPKTRPNPIALSPRTVGKLIREHLA